MYYKLKKCVCCTLNVTIAARIIAFIGILISVLLMTVLLNDKFNDKKENYALSRKMALAFGLDWQHIHSETSTAQHKDPEGKMISILLIFYASFFLLLNLLLSYAAIKGDWRCAVPWLICEFLGCLSKFGALIYHLCLDQNSIDNIFVIGSILYIVIMVWWWIVVFLAQLSWKHKDSSVLDLELSSINSSKDKDPQDMDVGSGKLRFFQDQVKDAENMDSPGPYSPNKMYSVI